MYSHRTRSTVGALALCLALTKRSGIAMLAATVLATACGELPNGGTEPEVTIRSALPEDGMHGFMIVLDREVGLAVNAYGGAVSNGPVKAVRGCTWENPDCTWTYVGGALLSDRNRSLGIRPQSTAAEAAKLTLSTICGSSIGPPPAECRWIYKDGRFINEANTNLAFYITAFSDPISDAQDLRLRAGCVNNSNPSSNDGCFWSLQGAMISVKSDSTLSMVAWSEAEHGNTVRLSNNCTRDNPKCTWTFRRGMIVSDNNPALAINSWGGRAVGTEMKLNDSCARTNADCTWVLRNGVLIAGTTTNFTSSLVMSAPTLTHGTTIRLTQGCAPPPLSRDLTAPNCSYSIRTAGPQCGYAGQHACDGVTCFEGRLVPRNEKCIVPLSVTIPCSTSASGIGVSITASLKIGLSNTGDWSMKVHAHNSGAASPRYTLGFLFAEPDLTNSRQYGYATQGTLGGTFDQESRSDDYIKNGNDGALEKGWDSWVAAGLAACLLEGNAGATSTPLQTMVADFGYPTSGTVTTLRSDPTTGCGWDANDNYTCPQ